jgi:hypothetical protein
MKKALVRATCSAPDSGGWKCTPWPTHPVAAGGRIADHQPREMLVGPAAGDLEQVLPVLLLGVGLHQHVLRCIVHAAQVARVHASCRHARRAARPPAAARARRLRAAVSRGTQRGVAAADDEDVGDDVDRASVGVGLEVGWRWVGGGLAVEWAVGWVAMDREPGHARRADRSDATAHRFVPGNDRRRGRREVAVAASRTMK